MLGHSGIELVDHVIRGKVGERRDRTLGIKMNEFADILNNATTAR
jgi:hypothetical protein